MNFSTIFLKQCTVTTSIDCARTMGCRMPFGPRTARSDTVGYIRGATAKALDLNFNSVAWGFSLDFDVVSVGCGLKFGGCTYQNILQQHAWKWLLKTCVGTQAKQHLCRKASTGKVCREHPWHMRAICECAYVCNPHVRMVVLHYIDVRCVLNLRHHWRCARIMTTITAIGKSTASHHFWNDVRPYKNSHHNKNYNVVLMITVA